MGKGISQTSAGDLTFIATRAIPSRAPAPADGPRRSHRMPRAACAGHTLRIYNDAHPLAECFTLFHFHSRKQKGDVIIYNPKRRHSAQNGMPPSDFARAMAEVRTASPT